MNIQTKKMSAMNPRNIFDMLGIELSAEMKDYKLQCEELNNFCKLHNVKTGIIISGGKINFETEFSHYDYFMNCSDFTIDKTKEMIIQLASVEMYDFGSGITKYKFYLQFSFSKKDSEYECHKHIYAVENFTKDDIELLSNYCQCAYHTSKWCRPCQCCVGCLQIESSDILKHDNMSTKLIQLRKARKYYEECEKKKFEKMKSNSFFSKLFG